MTTDIRKTHPVFTRTPAGWHPYIALARLDRPIGTWLLLLPCWWSLAMASGGVTGMDSQTLRYAALFALGAVVMRGAGCVVNDLWDRDLDAAVTRTRVRPLPAGEVTVKQAMMFLGALLGIGLLVLLRFNGLTVLLGVLSLGLVVAYPLMKRVTWWPQAFLGLTFNWGALMGWSALEGGMNIAPLLAYTGGIFWTLAYDTIYAHQDKEDDALAGIKSTARLFGGKSKIWVGGFFALALVLFAAAKIYAGGFGYGLALWALPAAHAVWQLKNWRMDDAASSLAMFRANRDFGLLLLIFFAA
ncbi:MAG TPA: 4-hydroxybenzoate octaprenyltransferase [Alphaproteobacteria bacterium]|nr:4-hydroxybenzoate octaprenyltransferase [Rhodospirillaceae bacterium]HRJ67158.1 4-hydroxybenzoate octaprenyltransferase [Alphaproteobacteria bacterium]